MSELDTLMESFGAAGMDKGILSDAETAHLVVDHNRILSMRGIAGMRVDTQETENGISATIKVEEGVKIEKPVHLCFGMLHKQGLQEIKTDVRLERGSSAHFIAHCIFPKAEKIRHVMEAGVSVGEGAGMRYEESHYHGLQGGIEVVPTSTVRIEKDGRYFSDFTLTTGRVGTLEIDYTVEAGENAVTELTARVFGHATDDIKVKEKVVLSGENARGIIKTRIAVEDDAKAEVVGVTEGNAAGARGHVDCMEIVKDRATAKAIPVVTVVHPLAKVTHEAAIGSVDKRQMETLMAHGLTPEEAVDVIVKGILR